MIASFPHFAENRADTPGQAEKVKPIANQRVAAAGAVPKEFGLNSKQRGDSGDVGYERFRLSQDG